MVLIGCVTVFQCHHHDASGHAFFLMTGDEELAAGFRVADCHAHDGNENGHDGETAQCGMHLDEAQPVSKSNGFHGMAPDWAFIPAVDTSRSGFENITIDNAFLEERAEVAVGYRRHVPLRGPPCV